MTEISAALDRIREVADRKGGLVELALVAGVPYTTVHSFAKRGWTHKNIRVIEKLSAAADEISARGDEAAA
jgi:soluble P-type ATPase